MNTTFPTHLKYAKSASLKSTMRDRVGACLVVGKSILNGHNKNKTHTIYANPNKHNRLSVHAELDCLNKAPVTEDSIIYVYREVHGKPAIARPCEHCMEFLKKARVKRMVYSIPDHPYWKEEDICY